MSKEDIERRFGEIFDQYVYEHSHGEAFSVDSKTLRAATEATIVLYAELEERVARLELRTARP
ncbi:MAG: hypothetical protein WDA41_09395 [Candidatus Neomarinimicrobiota bacterium]